MILILPEKWQCSWGYRKVEGRKGMVYVEEDWVDEANVAHRGADE
jgi:hypothetical protein